jgi:hypothetical protein
MKFRGILLVPSLAFSLFLGSCVFGSDPVEGGGGTEGQGVSLSGRLVTAEGAPLAGAVVRLYPVDSSVLGKGFAVLRELAASAKADSLQTGADGRFNFPKVEKGTYDLIATGKQGDTVFSLIRRNLVLDKNTNLGTDTVRPSGSLLLQVRVAGGGLVTGAACQISGTPWTVYSNDQGTCAFTGLPPATFRVNVRHISYPGGNSSEITVVSRTQVHGGTVLLGETPADTGTGGPDTTGSGGDTLAIPAALAHFAFSEGSGTFTTAQGAAGLTAQIYGPAWNAAGGIGGDLSFNGSAHHLTAQGGQALTGFQAFTVEAWIKPATSLTAARQRIAAVWGPRSTEDDSWAFEILADGSLTLAVARGDTWDKSSQSGAKIAVGQWNHVAGVYASGSIRLYLNGVEVYNGPSISGPTAVIDRPLEIGAVLALDGSASASWPGEIDELKFYGSALTASEVGQNYLRSTPASHTPGLTSRLLAHFPFNEGSGTAAASSGAATLGPASVNGAQWSAGVSGSGLLFNGTNNSVVLQDAQALTGMSKLTVESWVKLTEYGGPYQRIAAVWSGSVAAWTLTVFTDGYFGMEVYAGSSANEDKASRSSRKVPLDEWVHLTGVYSGDSIILYMNGERVYAKASIKKVLPRIQQRLEVGCILSPTDGSVTFSWPGSIDELKIYDTTLTDAQILASYLQNRPLVTTPAPLAHFAFAEGAGTVASAQGSAGLTAQVNGPSWSPNGAVGGSLLFNGATHHAVVANAQALTGFSAFTVEAWVKPTSALTAQWQRIAAVWGPASSSDDSWSFSVLPGGEVTLEVARGSTNDKSAVTTTAIPMGQWSHIAGVYSSGTIRLYINGVERYSGTSITGATAVINRPLEIGAILEANGAVSSSWPGQLDELKIYGTALTAQQVSQSYWSASPAP